MTSQNQDTYAAIDLGSNSFHMIVARENDGQLVIIDKIKEMVRIAGGLTSDQMLSEDAMNRGLECLERFGQRLKEIPASNIRAVGTNTLRQAHNGAEFLRKGKQALGHRIEIIAGLEEARLIYVGVAHTVFNDQDKRLVVDIGGGSTEVIIGQGFEPILLESLYMGCVNMTNRYFASGEISQKKMQKAIVFARQELEAIENVYKQYGWDMAIGSSGTINAIHEVIKQNGWGDKGITRQGLQCLQDKLIEIGTIEGLQLAGLSTKRTPVFAGGVAILCAVFDALEIEEMDVSSGALREGLLYDLFGRTHHQDIREKTVKNMVRQFRIDKAHIKRIAATVGTLFEQLKQDWCLEPQDLKLMQWAVKLHTIGMRVAHSQYQRHGAYLVENSDMPGFSRQEQETVSTLIRFHRRKLTLDAFTNSGDQPNEKLLRMCLMVRLAILLHRSRSRDPLPAFSIEGNEKTIKLSFPSGWLAEKPLTGADLETEAGYLESVGIKLDFE